MSTRTRGYPRIYREANLRENMSGATIGLIALAIAGIALTLFIVL